ncbi:hypothetical protein NA78x_002472 [Anatilimnocola sp. NA78]|uniref:hypothetical protein n=1 Tax=Anatilimnocola sp. NA78 TaxID=3415683 RepID=UPI003CE51F65
MADITSKAAWGVAAPEDQDIIDGTQEFDTWAKMPAVTALIKEGEELAERLLRELEPAVRQIADIATRIRGVAGRNLHTIVEAELQRNGSQ